MFLKSLIYLITICRAYGWNCNKCIIGNKTVGHTCNANTRCPMDIDASGVSVDSINSCVAINFIVKNGTRYCARGCSDMPMNIEEDRAMLQREACDRVMNWDSNITKCEAYICFDQMCNDENTCYYPPTEYPFDASSVGTYPWDTSTDYVGSGSVLVPLGVLVWVVLCVEFILK